MGTRSGPFRDSVEGRIPPPRAAATLGLEFVAADPEGRTIELAFTATEDFTNPTGNVLGAFHAAMLYDTVGPALLATLSSRISFSRQRRCPSNSFSPCGPDGSSAGQRPGTEKPPQSRGFCAVDNYATH